MLNLYNGLERWQSGRSHRTRNAAYGQPYRGFESLPLRQNLFPTLLTAPKIEFKTIIYERFAAHENSPPLAISHQNVGKIPGRASLGTGALPTCSPSTPC